MLFFFFKQKTAYEMRISDWSSDVCSSDLANLVSHLGERACPVMCRSARLNANQAWRQLRKERQHLLAVQLLHQHRGAVLIDAVRLENALRQIQSYRRNPHRERSSFFSGARSEERRVGKECLRTCRSRRSP